MKRFKIYSNSSSLLKACSLGVVISFFSAAAMSFIAPIFIINEYCDQDVLQWFCGIIQLVSTFLGALVCGTLSRDNVLTAAVLGGICWFALLICMGILLFDGAIGGIVLEGVAGLVGCALAVFVLIRQRNTPIKRKKVRRAH